MSAPSHPSLPPLTPRPATLSFGCHCHPASASPLRSVLAWRGGQGHMGGGRVEVTPQRGSWEHGGLLPRNHSEKRRERRKWNEGTRQGDIWCSKPFQTLMTRLIEARQKTFILDPLGLSVPPPPPNGTSTAVELQRLTLALLKMSSIHLEMNWGSCFLNIPQYVSLMICLSPSLVSFPGCQDCLTVLLSSGPRVTLWGCNGSGVSHPFCWDRLQENSQYSNYILGLSIPPTSSQLPPPPRH